MVYTLTHSIVHRRLSEVMVENNRIKGNVLVVVLVDRERLEKGSGNSSVMNMFCQQTHLSIIGKIDGLNSTKEAVKNIEDGHLTILSDGV